MYWLVKKLIKGASQRSKRKILNFVLSTEIESHVFHKLRRHGFVPATIIDVGAYQGEWTRNIKSIFPESKVHMIDALAKEDYLRKVQENLPGVSYGIHLLGSETGLEKTFFECETGSSYYEENTNVQKTQTTRKTKTLDEVIAETGFALSPSSLLKIDAQGAELDILKGAKQVLSDVDFVYLEMPIIQYNRNAPDFEAYIHHMASLGYGVFDVSTCQIRQDFLLQVDLLFARQTSPIIQKREQLLGI
ncbi:FkbM family methyltransferase [Candidatus Nitronereus thalassa]|uniref:FkbM family methyltransferase n=1 Tax=Candidatus Nitronereus thalassa TaxID=3020898 RepID=A0ABU3K4U1_9BACT|nr:FkbM family methyltransferase [Candidatus Nitronereus thalassa]MDT7041430.1 FkbM family methyltransferase [Candidatus Nitronereus thalassa]